MTPMMPELLEKISRKTGATFEMIPTENTLFGPTITTAGLLVGADIARALAGRTDLDLALIPAESINEDRIFLDDVARRVVALDYAGHGGSERRGVGPF